MNSALNKDRFSPWREKKNITPKIDNFTYLPQVVELNTGPTCNLTCSFCPRASGWTDSGDYFKLTLADKIAVELESFNFNGLIQFTGYGEPLQHPQIYDLVKVFSKRKLKVELTTNGTYLKRTVAKKLCNSGLSYLRVSLYHHPKQIGIFEKRLEGIPFENVMLIKRWDPDKFDTKTNRAGYFVADPLNENFKKRPCNYPFYHMLINHTGEVFLCPQDWSLKYSLGNVNNSSIKKIWRSKEYQKYRNILAFERTIKPCCDCDADGLVYHNQSRMSWVKEFSNDFDNKKY